MSADINKTANRKPGRRRIVMVWVLIISVASMGTIFSGVFSPREPNFEGKSLSVLLDDLYKSANYNPYSQDYNIIAAAAKPIREIGNAAAPFLIKRLRSGLAADRYFYKLQEWPTRLPFKILEPALRRRAEKANEATLGFKVLGEKASNALPGLNEMLAENDEIHYGHANLILQSVAYIGTPAALSVISNGLAGTNYEILQASVYAAGYYGERGTSFVPGLILVLTNASETLSMRCDSARSLGMIDEPEELVRSALCCVLSSTNQAVKEHAAIALALMGKKAEAAIPDIETHLKKASGKLDSEMLMALIVLCHDDARIVAALEKNFHFPGGTQAGTSDKSVLFSGVFESVRTNWIKGSGPARREIRSALEKIKPTGESE